MWHAWDTACLQQWSIAERGRGDVSKVIEVMQYAVAWKQNSFRSEKACHLEIVFQLGQGLLYINSFFFIQNKQCISKNLLRTLTFIFNHVTEPILLYDPVCNLKVKVKSLSRVGLFATPWTIAYQAPPSMGFSRQECWSGLPFPSPGDLPDLGIEPRSPAQQADALPSEPPGKPQ